MHRILWSSDISGRAQSSRQTPGRPGGGGGGGTPPFPLSQCIPPLPQGTCPNWGLSIQRPPGSAAVDHPPPLGPRVTPLHTSLCSRARVCAPHGHTHGPHPPAHRPSPTHTRRTETHAFPLWDVLRRRRHAMAHPLPPSVAHIGRSAAARAPFDNAAPPGVGGDVGCGGVMYQNGRTPQEEGAYPPTGPPSPPPPPRPKGPSREKTKFTIGKIWSGQFWYTNFWAPGPLPF